MPISRRDTPNQHTGNKTGCTYPTSHSCFWHITCVSGKIKCSSKIPRKTSWDLYCNHTTVQFCPPPNLTYPFSYSQKTLYTQISALWSASRKQIESGYLFQTLWILFTPLSPIFLCFWYQPCCCTLGKKLRNGQALIYSYCWVKRHSE